MTPPPSLLWWAGWLANRLPPRLALRGWMQSIEWMVRFYLLETNTLSLCWQKPFIAANNVSTCLSVRNKCFEPFWQKRIIAANNVSTCLFLKQRGAIFWNDPCHCKGSGLGRSISSKQSPLVGFPIS
jgi:hypothetical protein